MMDNFGIYIHIPFCESKCYYCNFLSKCCKKEVQKKYFQALWEDIKSKKNKKTVTSVYFGGGTPSFVDEDYIIKTCEILKKTFNLSKDCEISIECNPNSISEKKIISYKNAGINRISFGVQSFDDEILKKLNRKHNKKQAFDAIKLAKKVGFNNISIDLLLGIKNNLKNIKSYIKKCVNLGLTHLSAYMLILEKGTKLYNQKNTDFLLDDDKSVEQYYKLYNIMKEFHFERYEVSNFALKNFECRHNINYWKCGEYLGFGASAHSYIDGKRIANVNTIENYADKIETQIEILTRKQRIEEKIMLGLRLSSGIDINKIKALGYDIENNKKDELQYLKNNKIIGIKGHKIYVKPLYFGVLNKIILILIE